VVDNSVQDQQLPLGFSITPYHDERPPGPPRTRRSGFDWFRIGARLAAAALAIVACWARVQQLSSTIPDAGGENGFFFIRVSYDGWGRVTSEANQEVDFSSQLGGPNYGLLLCLAAAGLVAAAAAEWLPIRWRPSGRALAALAAAFLLAIALCQVIAGWPYHRLAATGFAYHHGLSPWLGGAGCLLAMLSCLPRPIRRQPIIDAATDQSPADRQAW